MNFLENLISKISKDIVISLSTDSVAFKTESKSTQVKPILYLSNARKPKVLAWGKGAPPTEAHLKINIFNYNEIGEKTSITLEECLVAFFSLGIREVVGRGSIVRPKIVVKNIDSLSDNAPKMPQDLIEKVLMQCGARLCEFI